MIVSNKVVDSYNPSRNEQLTNEHHIRPNTIERPAIRKQQSAIGARDHLQPLMEAMWGMGFISAIDVFFRV